MFVINKKSTRIRAARGFYELLNGFVFFPHSVERGDLRKRLRQDENGDCFLEWIGGKIETGNHGKNTTKYWGFREN